MTETVKRDWKHWLRILGGVIIMYLIMSGIAMTVVIVVLKLLFDWEFSPPWLMYLVGNFTPLELHARIIVLQLGLAMLVMVLTTIKDSVNRYRTERRMKKFGRELAELLTPEQRAELASDLEKRRGQ